jgi:hypothetical protein
VFAPAKEISAYLRCSDVDFMAIWQELLAACFCQGIQFNRGSEFAND